MYKVTQEFMDALIKWRDDENIDAVVDNFLTHVSVRDLRRIPKVVLSWWVPYLDTAVENNARLIAIIQWLNGEDVFEVEAPHKFIVRSKEFYIGNDYLYFMLVPVGEIKDTAEITDGYSATKFKTREEAQEWANSHQVVVEIDEDGNEV